MDISLERLLSDTKRAVAQAEALLEAGGERLGEARVAVTEHLLAAKDRVTDLERDMVRASRRSARRLDRYAHRNPWRVAGSGLALGLIVGTLLGLAIGSRRD